jgi:peptidoglycan pentaglycine glycine transferase (the first glycine)
MALITVAAADTAPPADWDALVVQVPGGHVLQSRAWAEHRAGQGWQPRFVRFTDGHGALLLVRRQPPIPGLVGYVPRGPVGAGDPPAVVAARAVALADWLAAAGGRVLTVDPELDQAPEYDRLVADRGFRERDEIQACRHRMIVELAPGATEDQLLQRMAKSARQRLRSAEAAGTVVEMDHAGRALDELMRMLAEAGQAKQFGVGDPGALMAWWRRALAAGLGRFLVARNAGTVVGGLFYYEQGGHLATAYSADDRATRSRLPGTMHLLRWRLLQLALERGDPHADLGGVDVAGARRMPRPGEPTYGLFEHKRSLGAEWRESAAAHEVVLRPWTQRLAVAAQVVRGLAGRARGGARG